MQGLKCFANYNMQKSMCRVCLRFEGITAIFDDFGTEEKFRYCTLLQLSPDDDLPKKLCHVCSNHLDIAYIFRLQASYTHDYFLKCSPLKNKNEISKVSNASADGEAALVETPNLLLPEKEFESLPVNESKSVTSGCYLENVQSASPRLQSTEATTEFYDYFLVSSDEKTGPNVDTLNTPVSNSKHLQTCTSDGNTSTELIAQKYTETALKILQFVKIDSKGKENIKCHVCSTSFTKIDLLRQHLKQHSGERPFQCEFCEKCFARKSVLTKHRRLHSGERPYQCDECPLNFSTKDVLTRHKTRKHTLRTKSRNECAIICKICSKRQCSKSALTAHLRIHHTRDNSITAPTATTEPHTQGVITNNKTSKKSFTRRSAFVAPKKMHKTSKLFQCSVCRCAFEKKFHLLYHLQTHDNAEELLKRYVNSRTMNESNVDDNDSADAPLAQKSKSQTKNPQSQEQSAEVEQAIAKRPSINGDSPRLDNIQTLKKKFICQLCKHTFTQSYSLKLHMMKHSGDRPYKCKHCEKSFARKYILGAHERLHTGEKPYKCDLCESAFVTKKARKRHTNKYHERENKMHNCGICHLVFASNHLLEEHTISHAEPKKKMQHLRDVNKDGSTFRCIVCPQTFPSLAAYTSHLDAHKPSNFFECDICKLRFAEKSNLLNHMQQQHVTDNHICMKCNGIFAIKEELIKHVKLKHFDKYNLDYRCADCEKGFYDMRDLKEHLLEEHDVGTAALNSCDACRQYFEEAQDYYKHMYDKHDEISKSCSECGASFQSRRIFDEHILGHYI